MTIVLDAGALIAVERNDRDLIALLKREHQAGRIPVTHGGIVGQVWRGGGRQTALGRFLSTTSVAPIDEDLGRSTGQLLARTRTRDVIDAALVLLARDGDFILTSDPDDLVGLAAALGADLEIIPV